MAGSRLDRIGNIFSRCTGLLRTGAMKYEDRPIWFDVYRVFPPKYEPRHERDTEPLPDVQPILYAEDLIRADFAKKYGPNPGGLVRNLRKHGEEDNCQKFILKYNDVQKNNPSWTHEQIFDSVASTFSFPTRTMRYSRKTFTLEDQEDEEALNRASRRKPKRTIITTASLLSMFKESKVEDSNNLKGHDDSPPKKSE